MLDLEITASSLHALQDFHQHQRAEELQIAVVRGAMMTRRRRLLKHHVKADQLS